jgi:hypothetical protein
MNPTDKSTAKQSESIMTILEQLQSLTHEFGNFRSNTDQNINSIKRFAETSDRSRAKEIGGLAKAMELRYDTESDQPLTSTPLATGVDHMTDDETDEPNISRRQRINHVTTRQRNDHNEDQGLDADKAIQTIETLRG